MPRQWRVLSAACLALAVLCAACTGSGSRGSPPASAGRAEATITVGSFDFPESILLAHIYAGALAAKGFPVRVMPDLGTRELVEPALMNGLIQIVPEYTGSALDFLSLGRRAATSDAAATYRALTRTAEHRGLVAAQPAPAHSTTSAMSRTAEGMFASSRSARLSRTGVIAGILEEPVWPFKRPPAAPWARQAISLRAHGMTI